MKKLYMLLAIIALVSCSKEKEVEEVNDVDYNMILVKNHESYDARGASSLKGEDESLINLGLSIYNSPSNQLTDQIALKGIPLAKGVYSLSQYLSGDESFPSVLYTRANGDQVFAFYDLVESDSNWIKIEEISLCPPEVKARIRARFSWPEDQENKFNLPDTVLFTSDSFQVCFCD